MKIVVLGANSFSGQDFVDLALDQPGVEVVGVSRSAERSPLFLSYRRRQDLSRYRYVQLDLNRTDDAILDLLDEVRPEGIVNFAAQSEVAPSWEQPEQWFQTNCAALARLVNHLRRRDYLKRFVQVSSPEVYGTCQGTVTEDAPLRPSTPYAASKAAADLLLSAYFRQYNFPVVTVRATNVYGAGQQLHKIIPRTAVYLKLGRTIELHGGGQAVKSFIHIRDVSRGEWQALVRGEPGALYHLSPDHGVRVRDVVRMICERMGRSFEEAASAVAERTGQDAAYVIDSTRARTEFGWSPRRALEQGLEEVIRWIEDGWEEIRRLPLEYQHQP